MFQDATGKPTEMRFLDYQLTRLASPVIDISYFLCFSAPEYIIENIEEYIQYYYKRFSYFLKELDTDVEKVYPFEIFMQHWKIHGKFGLALLLFVPRFTLAEKHETVSLASAEEFERTFMAAELENQKLLDERLMFVYKKFVALGWAE